MTLRHTRSILASAVGLAAGTLAGSVHAEGPTVDTLDVTVTVGAEVFELAAEPSEIAPGVLRYDFSLFSGAETLASVTGRFIVEVEGARRLSAAVTVAAGTLVDVTIDATHELIAGRGLVAWRASGGICGIAQPDSFVLGSQDDQPLVTYLVDGQNAASIYDQPIELFSDAVASASLPPVALLQPATLDDADSTSISYRLAMAVGPGATINTSSVFVADPNIADLNGDTRVDAADLGLMLAAWGTAGPGDLDGDGAVDGSDLGILLQDWTG